ncbi:MAG: hypothetical protein JSW61_08605 [Candidatus Thorarchaeota archaeon]|nr:MAG: hypothetical protein JSW61_08605 [Candidatus Thorarchaeota archaeon]
MGLPRLPSSPKLVAFAGVVLILSATAAMVLSNLFVHVTWRGEDIWYHLGTRVDSVTLNSTYPEVNVSIDADRLNIHYFNSSGNPISIIVTQVSTVILNHTQVSGVNISGVDDSPTEAPNFGESSRPYIVSFYWEGVDTTVSFEYEYWWNMHVDRFVTVTDSMYYVSVGAGRVLLAFGIGFFVLSLFLWSRMHRQE